MATLEPDDAAWWRYAIEFARRGLWPLAEIETHGPHGPPADRIWGEALCATANRTYPEIIFSGPSRCRHYSDIKGLRMCDKYDESCRFPILRPSEKNRTEKTWLAYARKRLEGMA